MTTQIQSRSPYKAADFLARFGIVLVLVIMVVALSILSPLIRGEQFFLTPRNLIQVALQASINAVIAVGMTMIIISGGIDLSVGAVVALTGILAAYAMKAGASPWIGFVVAVLGGALCGVFNGILITRFDLAPFIATLGTMGIFRGMALVISDGRPIYGFGREFLQIFAGNVGMIPVAVIVAVLAAVAMSLVLNQLKLGKYAIAIGGNEEATRLAGIPIQRYKVGIYALGGFLTGVAAALLTARLSAADPTAGNFFELDAIAATVIGGTSLSGGQGAIAGTIVGALVISLVRNGMNLFNVPSYWQEIAIGSVIILAVILDQWRRKRVQRVQRV